MNFLSKIILILLLQIIKIKTDSDGLVLNLINDSTTLKESNEVLKPTESIENSTRSFCNNRIQEQPDYIRWFLAITNGHRYIKTESSESTLSWKDDNFGMARYSTTEYFRKKRLKSATTKAPKPPSININNSIRMFQIESQYSKDPESGQFYPTIQTETDDESTDFYELLKRRKTTKLVNIFNLAGRLSTLPVNKNGSTPKAWKNHDLWNLLRTEPSVSTIPTFEQDFILRYLKEHPITKKYFNKSDLNFESSWSRGKIFSFNSKLRVLVAVLSFWITL